MSDSKKPGKPLIVTVQILEDRLAELSRQYRLLEEGEEKDRLTRQIHETRNQLTQLSFSSLNRKLSVKGIVDKKTKI